MQKDSLPNWIQFHPQYEAAWDMFLTLNKYDRSDRGINKYKYNGFSRGKCMIPISQGNLGMWYLYF